MLHCNNNYHIMFVRQCIEQNTSVLRKDLTTLLNLDLNLLHQLQSGHLCWRSPLIQILFRFRYLHRSETQSVASRLETSQYRDFSQFFESIGLGLEKKSRSRKYLVSKRSLGIGLENIWSRKKVSVSVSKTLVSKKVSVSVSKILVSKKVSVTT